MSKAIGIKFLFKTKRFRLTLIPIKKLHHYKIKSIK